MFDRKSTQQLPTQEIVSGRWSFGVKSIGVCQLKRSLRANGWGAADGASGHQARERSADTRRRPEAV